MILSPGAAPSLLSQGRRGKGGAEEMYFEYRTSALLHAPGDRQRESVSIRPLWANWVHVKIVVVAV